MPRNHETEEGRAKSHRRKRRRLCLWGSVPGEWVPQGAPQGPGLRAARGRNRDPGRAGIFAVRRKLSWAQKLGEGWAWVPSAPLPGTDSPGSGSTPSRTHGPEAQGRTPRDITLHWLQPRRPAGLALPQARAGNTGGAPRAETKARNTGGGEGRGRGRRDNGVTVFLPFILVEMKLHLKEEC